MKKMIELHETFFRLVNSVLKLYNAHMITEEQFNTQLEAVYREARIDRRVHLKSEKK